MSSATDAHCSMLTVRVISLARVADLRRLPDSCTARLGYRQNSSAPSTAGLATSEAHAFQDAHATMMVDKRRPLVGTDCPNTTDAGGSSAGCM